MTKSQPAVRSRRLFVISPEASATAINASAVIEMVAHSYFKCLQQIGIDARLLRMCTKCTQRYPPTPQTDSPTQKNVDSPLQSPNLSATQSSILLFQSCRLNLAPPQVAPHHYSPRSKSRHRADACPARPIPSQSDRGDALTARSAVEDDIFGHFVAVRVTEEIGVVARVVLRAICIVPSAVRLWP